MHPPARRRPRLGTALPAVLLALVATGCQFGATPDDEPTGASGPQAAANDGVAPQDAPGRPPGAAGAPVTIALGGDVHFEGGLVDVPTTPGSTLGPVSRVLRDADVAVVNLESALARQGVGRPARKENEDPSARYWFRSPPAALDVLARSGVDAVSLANNHGADLGVAGVRDTLRAEAASTVDVIGVGADDTAAFEPYRTTVRGTRVAVLAADSTLRESADPVWAARPGSGPGLATARLPHVRPMLAAVRAAAAVDDVVVVYLHWGAEYAACPTRGQRDLARVIAEAGADVVVGTHAHVLQGAGTLGDAYVSYGLGGLHWYHGLRPESGVLLLSVRDGGVVGDEWVPGEIPVEGGGPVLLRGAERRAAVADWRALRACTDLAPGPGPLADPAPDPAPDDGEGEGGGLPAYTSSVRRLPPALRARMTGTSHDPATCPVPLDDLRLLEPVHVGFDGRAHRGRIVVHADVAADVVEAFEALYRARFPIERMQLVDAYDGDDDRSMAANNTSGYNCRTVAGQSTFSQHAYGRAVDVNPVQNPYVVGGDVLPPAGRRFVDVARSPGSRPGPGVVVRGDVVTRTFARLGWTWGGDWSDPDYQHFDRR